MTRATHAFALAILVAGVASSSAGAATYRDAWVSFRYPGSWRVYHWEIPSTEVRYIAWLSNARVHDPCVRSRGSIDCSRPVRRLPPRGVLLTWLLSVLPGANLARSGIWIARPGSCRDVGADETVAKRFHGYFVEACLRGPGLARTQRDVLRVLRSAHFVTH